MPACGRAALVRPGNAGRLRTAEDSSAHAKSVTLTIRGSLGRQPRHEPDRRSSATDVNPARGLVRELATSRPGSTRSKSRSPTLTRREVRRQHADRTHPTAATRRDAERPAQRAGAGPLDGAALDNGTGNVCANFGPADDAIPVLSDAVQGRPVISSLPVEALRSSTATPRAADGRPGGIWPGWPGQSPALPLHGFEGQLRVTEARDAAVAATGYFVLTGGPTCGATQSSTFAPVLDLGDDRVPSGHLAPDLHLEPRR